MTDPTLHAAELQRADAILNHPNPFAPEPESEAPWWLEAVCWAFMAVIFISTVRVIGNPVGWLVG